MVRLTINGNKLSVPEDTTIMEAARQVGIDIPHLCYLKEINEIGACRVCVVEVEGMDTLVSACNTLVREGMVLHTNSPKVRAVRKINVELILSDHNVNCAACVRSANCNLQKIANNLGILEIPYENITEISAWDKTFPLIRDSTKCIKCMRCIQVCDKIQDLRIWNLSGSGFRTTIDVSANESMREAGCSLCGQCITHCPVGALRERDDVDEVFDALADPEKITMVQVAPAVRTAWGEGLGLGAEEINMGKLISVLRKIGFDYIYETAYAADLTIMEEGSEFIERFKEKKDYKWPMFTSCCPGWVRFAKSQYPEIIGHLSTAKSPQQMFGAMSKTYIAQKMGIDPSKVFSVSIMPCVSKKFECDVEQINGADVGKDVDMVLTTREVDRMIRADSIQIQDLKEEEFDEFFGEGTGAGIIFGATGGVMEAALRSAHYLLTGKNPKPDAFKNVRGQEGWKESIFEIEGVAVKTAIVSGLGNTRKLIEAIRAGKVQYDFVEVMACPGGCAGGGGQPIHDGEERAEERGKILYGIDRTSQRRFSHENKAVQMTYDEYLGKPLSNRAHELLHTDLTQWEIK